MSFAVATVAGRLGHDPSSKEVGSGTVTTFSLAVDQYNGKNKEKTTQWWDCECWSPAQALLKYVNKGDFICVSGLLRQDVVTKDGTNKRYNKLRVEQVALAPKNSKSDGERIREESGAEEEAGF